MTVRALSNNFPLVFFFANLARSWSSGSAGRHAELYARQFRDWPDGRSVA